MSNKIQSNNNKQEYKESLSENLIEIIIKKENKRIFQKNLILILKQQNDLITLIRVYNFLKEYPFFIGKSILKTLYNKCRILTRQIKDKNQLNILHNLILKIVKMSKKYLKHGKNIKYYIKYTNTQKGGSIIGSVKSLVGNTVSTAGHLAGNLVGKISNPLIHLVENTAKRLSKQLTGQISSKFSRMIGMCGGTSNFTKCIANQSINPAMEASITACIGGGVETLGAACGPAVIEVIGVCCNPFKNLSKNPLAKY